MNKKMSLPAKGGVKVEPFKSIFDYCKEKDIQAAEIDRIVIRGIQGMMANKKAPCFLRQGFLYIRTCPDIFTRNKLEKIDEEFLSNCRKTSKGFADKDQIKKANKNIKHFEDIMSAKGHHKRSVLFGFKDEETNTWVGGLFTFKEPKPRMVDNKFNSLEDAEYHKEFMTRKGSFVVYTPANKHHPRMGAFLSVTMDNFLTMDSADDQIEDNQSSPDTTSVL